MSGDDKLNIALDGVGLAASVVGAGAIAVGAAPVAIGAAAVGATVALGSLAVSSFVGSNADKGVAASGVVAGIGPSFLPEAGSRKPEASQARRRIPS